MSDCRPATTPLSPAIKLSSLDSPATDEERQAMENIPYRSAIGSLMYLAFCTRPDIASAISSLSRFNATPGKSHWEGVLYVMRYLKGTLASGIRYRMGACTELWGFRDAGHLICPDVSRARASFDFMSAGGVVSWQSKLVGNASLSSCESEYMGLAMAGQEVSFLRQLQIEMQGAAAVPKPVRVFLGSEPAIDLVYKPVYHPRTKQI